MRAGDSEPPFLIAYLTALAAQIPIWLCAGLMWEGIMIALVGRRPVNPLIDGLGMALFLWLSCGNLLALGFAWRRTAHFHAPNRTQFRSALDQACDRLKLKVLTESPHKVVLVPRRSLIRIRPQEIWITFTDEEATVTTPAISIGAVRQALVRALAESSHVQPASERADDAPDLADGLRTGDS